MHSSREIIHEPLLEAKIRRHLEDGNRERNTNGNKRDVSSYDVGAVAGGFSRRATAPPENIPSHKLEHCVCRLMDAPERWVGKLGGDLVRS